MALIWHQIASSERWRGVVGFISNWIGPFDSGHGIPAKELDSIMRDASLHLPTAVREWFLLAANWRLGRLNVWFSPEVLKARDGMVAILTDTEGINLWGFRIKDVGIDDPPVISITDNPDEIAFPRFSTFVAAMIVNDVLFDDRTEAPTELSSNFRGTGVVRLVASNYGEFFSDTPIESAAVVIFAYPNNGPVIGKARTPVGRQTLERLQKKP